MNYLHSVMWDAVQELVTTRRVRPSIHMFASDGIDTAIKVLKTEERLDHNTEEYDRLVSDFKMDIISDIPSEVHSFMFVQVAKIAFSDTVADDAILGQVVDRAGRKITLCIPLVDSKPIDDISMIHMHDLILDRAFMPTIYA